MKRRSFRHSFLTLCVGVLLLAACGPATDDTTGPAAQPTSEPAAGSSPGSPTDGSGGAGEATPTGPATTGGSQGDAGSGGGGDNGGGGGGDGGGTEGGGTDGPPPATTDDLGRVGANGRAYLRPDHPSLIVEIDVQEGVSPGDGPVDHLIATIRKHADKPGGVQLAGGNTFASDRREWTRDDLRAAAEENRQHYSDEQVVVLYFLYVRGGFYQGGEETRAIGVTYNASEIALFPDRWSGLGTLVGADRNVERAVLVHEFGHALGLVNITYQSDIDHEDPDHPHHSSNKGSVMHYAVETTLVGQVFEGPPPDSFDDADTADIEGLKSGRY
ncbi:MAG: hypothetical protein R3343_03785 [Nitriliruptorales bacterium]|nr:hypothetical protein [Nitriliruptorales bacterium]